jgi:hypothetical protein
MKRLVEVIILSLCCAGYFCSCDMPSSASPDRKSEVPPPPSEPLQDKTVPETVAPDETKSESCNCPEYDFSSDIETAVERAITEAEKRWAELLHPKCSENDECGTLEICIDSRCETALNRVYEIRVEEIRISERRATGEQKGKTWDMNGGLPDPLVQVAFPDIDKFAFKTKVLRDRTHAKWKSKGAITVTAGGQSIYFCYHDYDRDGYGGIETDPLSYDEEGKYHCDGFRDVIDFIKKGLFEKQYGSDREVQYFKATIERR